MAGSGRSDDTKSCGKCFGVIYLGLFLIMSFILIGISVRICEKVGNHAFIPCLGKLLLSVQC